MTDQAHLFPFFWLRGEDEQAIRQGLQSVSASGCGSVCVESRVHPDYLGPGWWRDLDIVTDECRRLGMTFYVMDDMHYPSGYANGAAKGTPFCRTMMTERHMDVVGPRKGGHLCVRSDEAKGELVAVVAARRLDTGTLQRSFVDIGGWALSDPIDLTDHVRDGLVAWDVPEGIWRVLVMTAQYVSERNPPRFFVNPLLPQGGQLMLDTVYEPHYAHLKAVFGTVFAGFFSDEPALRAGRGSHAVLGEYPALPIPWRMDLTELLTQRLGTRARALLPGLWYDIGPDTPRLRYAMMDLVSSLYSEHYAMPIGDWCRSHGVEYVGHVIEQGDAHSRLGQGAGHYFRAVAGQSMSGMDYVLHELRPEFRGSHHAWKSQDFEAEDDFFRYMLPQMTVSAAHLDPKKKGRALCEIFGAYGWQEDVGEMRYLANLLLSRGVNYFTPHAFTLAPFPDPDAPPHFGPFNPLMPAIGRLFGHINRAAALLDGGHPATRAAALYYAEGEWASGSGVMKTQQIVRELNQHQIACMVVPIDALRPGDWDALLIPRAGLWPEKLYRRLPELAKSGCRVAFVDEAPHGVSEGDADVRALSANCETVPLSQAAEWTARICPPLLRPMEPCPDIQVYPYKKDGRTVWALFNECAHDDRILRAEVQDAPALVLYDTELQRCAPVSCHFKGRAAEVAVRLTPGQLLILGEWQKGWPPVIRPARLTQGAPIQPLWTLSFSANGPDGFVTDEPFELLERFPRFAGTVRCECELDLPQGCAGLLFPKGAGAMTVLLDGVVQGNLSAPPYRFCCTAGRHRLSVEITTTLFPRHRDELSFFNYIKPVWLAGPVTPLLPDTTKAQEAL